MGIRTDLMTLEEKELYRSIPRDEVSQIKRLYESGFSVRGVSDALPEIEVGKIEFICQFLER